MIRGGVGGGRRLGARLAFSFVTAFVLLIPRALAIDVIDLAISARRSFVTTSSGILTDANERPRLGGRPAALAMTRSGRTATIFSTFGCRPPAREFALR